jgi:hypothetical protein
MYRCKYLSNNSYNTYQEEYEHNAWSIMNTKAEDCLRYHTHQRISVLSNGTYKDGSDVYEVLKTWQTLSIKKNQEIIFEGSIEKSF